jgi:NitT/TauT family transport system substrate-binding protein
MSVAVDFGGTTTPKRPWLWSAPSMIVPTLTPLPLAETGGAKIVGDDTKAAKNLSQTVLLFSDEYLAKPGGQTTVDGVLSAWDVAVNDINKNPENYRKVLVDKARLPAPLAETYKVQTYPTTVVPTQADVDAVLTWMKDKGYLKADVTYDQIAGLPKD